MRMYAICSNPDCTVSASGTYNEPIGRYCLMCGAAYLKSCPHCGFPVAGKGAKHCTECAKPLKETAQA